jgi:hypothetical protein
MKYCMVHSHAGQAARVEVGTRIDLCVVFEERRVILIRKVNF